MLDDGAADFDSFFAAAKADDTRAMSSTHFARDCQWIVQQAQTSADTLPGIGALVLLSIRQPFYLMPMQMKSLARMDYKCPYLFGWKSDGLMYLRMNKRALHKAARACYEGDMSLDDLILEYLAVPGMGIVKASFFAQMTVGNGACLDTLNLRTLGLNETAFRLAKTLSVKTVRRRIASYNACWQSVGDSSYWWDSWCELVASRTRNVRGYAIQGFRSAADVSHSHRMAITGGIK